MLDGVPNLLFPSEDARITRTGNYLFPMRINKETSKQSRDEFLYALPNTDLLCETSTGFAGNILLADDPVIEKIAETIWKVAKAQ